MDVNGTRFHLITGREDWDQVLRQSDPPDSLEWDGEQAVRLQRLPQRFPRGRRSRPLDPAQRRGAAVDRFGTWYWIDAERRSLFRAAAGTGRAKIYWQPGSRPPSAGRGNFAPAAAPAAPAELSGLAVTAHHYLLAGSLDPAGLLIFDLHSGGEPLVLNFPTGFTPFDIAASPDGGAWVLDSANRQLWRVDRYFRLCPLVVASPPAASGQGGAFQPETPPLTPTDFTSPPPPAGMPLPCLSPTAIEVLPGGSLLILDAPAAPGLSSRILHFDLGPEDIPFLSSTQELPSIGGPAEPPVVGHDFAYLAGTNRLVVVERDGNQAMAYALPAPAPGHSLPALRALPDYLPMHYYGSRALVAAPPPWGYAGCQDCRDLEPAFYYDVTPSVSRPDAATRWVVLRAIDQPHYARYGEVIIPRLDGHQPGCTWHRLVLDGCIPAESAVTVETRAGDDPDLLAFQPFLPEPPLYLRQAGAEVPYFRPFSDPLAENQGSWELLFQQAKGRFLEIRLTLSGNGRVSPAIQALRAWYPRYSYLERYLPAAYREEPSSASFLERMLANFEGFYTEIEGKIASFAMLLDPRSAPAETLDWLGNWLGLVLDPLWARLQEERAREGTLYQGVVAPPSLTNVSDRRRLLIRFAMRLYARRGTPEGLRFALLLLLDPCLEAYLKRFKEAARRPDLALRDELTRLGLPYPTPATDEEELEDTLYQYVLRSQRSERVRLVERWQTRQGQALQAGDPTTQNGTAAPTISLADQVRAAAHRFSVLVPEGLSQAESAMVERIIRLEKPAHAAFDTRRFWDFFRVGEARVGLDTVLGEDGRFLPIILGRDYLSEGYLEAAHPMNITERAVSDRDRLGDMLLGG